MINKPYNKKKLIQKSKLKFFDKTTNSYLNTLMVDLDKNNNLFFYNYSFISVMSVFDLKFGGIISGKYSEINNSCAIPVFNYVSKNIVKSSIEQILNLSSFDLGWKVKQVNISHSNFDNINVKKISSKTKRRYNIKKKIAIISFFRDSSVKLLANKSYISENEFNFIEYLNKELLDNIMTNFFSKDSKIKLKLEFDSLIQSL